MVGLQWSSKLKGNLSKYGSIQNLGTSSTQNSSGATRTSRTSHEIRVTICTIRSSGECEVILDETASR